MEGSYSLLDWQSLAQNNEKLEVEIKIGRGIKRLQKFYMKNKLNLKEKWAVGSFYKITIRVLGIFLK